LLFTFATDYKLANTLASDSILQKATSVESADSDINAFVSAAFLINAGKIEST
jgi:hypothetical protein